MSEETINELDVELIKAQENFDELIEIFLSKSIVESAKTLVNNGTCENKNEAISKLIDKNKDGELTNAEIEASIIEILDKERLIRSNYTSLSNVTIPKIYKLNKELTNLRKETFRLKDKVISLSKKYNHAINLNMEHTLRFSDLLDKSRKIKNEMMVLEHFLKQNENKYIYKLHVSPKFILMTLMVGIAIGIKYYYS